MDDDLEQFWGSKEEEMEAEGAIVEGELRRACANCLDNDWTQEINGSHLCDTCAAMYPKGMPF